jgi:hypothetical protein
MQTRLGSLAESCVNIGIGYGVAVASQVVILPLFNVHLPLRDNMVIGAYFTVISLIRSYAVRRLFNRRSRQ